MEFLKLLPNDFYASGFSMSLEGDVPETGYMVSYEGFERVLDKVTKKDIEDYVNENEPYICLLPPVYIGGWLDAETGRYYLDISQNVQTLPEALALAAARRQIAVYDVENNVSIYV